MASVKIEVVVKTKALHTMRGCRASLLLLLTVALAFLAASPC